MQQSELLIIVGKKIKVIRKRLEMSQTTLAHLAGTDKHYICRLEGGKGNPTLKMLHTISIHLQTPLAELL